MPYNPKSQPKLSFICRNVYKFEFSYEKIKIDEGELDQIFKLYFEKSEDYITLIISGIYLSGFIICENIQILKL